MEDKDLQDKDFDLYHVAGKEEHQFVPDALSRLCVNRIPPPPTLADKSIVALRPVMNLPQDVHDELLEADAEYKDSPTLSRLCSISRVGISVGEACDTRSKDEWLHL